MSLLSNIQNAGADRYARGASPSMRERRINRAVSCLICEHICKLTRQWVLVQYPSMCKDQNVNTQIPVLYICIYVRISGESTKRPVLYEEKLTLQAELFITQFKVISLRN